MEALKAYLRSLPSDAARKKYAAACNTTIGHLRNVIGGSRTAAPELAVALELRSDGRVPCTHVRPDLRWSRTRDSDWPHKRGRPLLDLATSVGAITVAAQRSGARTPKRLATSRA